MAREGVPFLKLALQRPVNFFLLEPCFRQVNKCKVACWRMRLHVEQSTMVPAKTILDQPVYREPTSRERSHPTSHS